MAYGRGFAYPAAKVALTLSFFGSARAARYTARVSVPKVIWGSPKDKEDRLQSRAANLRQAI